ncbi:hypothetical protein [Bradyrhizobium archetypum]|nr:hypothetical protein [Bradyrhizobium archetypum]
MHKSLLWFKRNAKRCEPQEVVESNGTTAGWQAIFSCRACRAAVAQRSLLYLSICASLAMKPLRSNDRPAFSGHIAMFVSKLPPKPDFDMLAAAAPASADRRTFILALMGNLICSWSNNESLFIYVLMILLRTDEASAAVVFATLNTTRARLDLIQRLAKIRVSDKALSKNLTTLIERFSESTKVRNELNHCMFIFDSSGAITHTQSMRLMETRSSLRFGEIKALDESRLQEMLRTTNEMTKINREIWDLLPRLEAHVHGVQPKAVPLDAA